MVLVSFKTVKGDSFSLELDGNEKVSSLKAKVEEAKGSSDFPQDSIKVIHQGKILDDDSTVEENGITEKSFCVIMVTKKKPPPAPAVQPQEGLQAASTPPEAPAVQEEAAAAAQSQEEPIPVSGRVGESTPVSALGSSELLTGPALEERISQLCEMGFPREEVQKAMRAAFNNTERAVEYLMSGVPEGLGQAPSDPTAPTSQAPPPQASSQPFDMFAPEGTQGAQNTAQPEGEEGPLDFLRHDRQFQILRGLVQSNPQLLQPMLSELGRSNPDLLARINEHQQEFISLVNEPIDQADMEALMATMAEGDEGGTLPENAVQVELTEAEAEAVGRLESMGFPRSVCLEAFLICDKNEQMAANYLLEHGMDP